MAYDGFYVTNFDLGLRMTDKSLHSKRYITSRPLLYPLLLPSLGRPVSFYLIFFPDILIQINTRERP